VTLHDELRGLQQAAVEARAAADKAEQALTTAQTALQDLQARPRVSRQTLERAQRRVERARARQGKTRLAADAANATYRSALTALPGTLDPTVPLLLLPVRLETRFRNSDLLVRVYPDAIHVDDHEPELTEAEIRFGQEFWRQTWQAASAPAGEVEPARRAAWSQLTGRVGSTRAAWIAQMLTPRNAPTPDLPPPLGTEPAFPSPPTRLSSLARPAQTTVLPDRWVALGYRGQSFHADTRIVTVEGELIPRPLPVGLGSPRSTGDPGDPVEDGIRWMVEFDEAVRVGMGLVVPLPAAV
jgi:hypothetical protein